MTEWLALLVGIPGVLTIGLLGGAALGGYAGHPAIGAAAGAAAVIGWICWEWRRAALLVRR